MKILLVVAHVLAIVLLAMLAAYKDYKELSEEPFTFNNCKWSTFMMAPGAFAMFSLMEMLEGWHVSVYWLLPLGILYFATLVFSFWFFGRYFPHHPENPEE